MKRLAGLILTLTVLAAGCGYSFQKPSQSPLYGVRRLSIPVVGNATTYHGLTNSLTNDLIQRFGLSRRFRLASPDESEAVLSVQIAAVQIEGAARARTYDASASRRITVTVGATLRLVDTGQVLWENRKIIGRRIYTVSEDQSLVEANLSRVMEDVAQELAEKIHDRLVEAF
ncbi:MAG: LPS assembly lipoprotein LptE [Thermodesulfobacteriota bacterium]